MSFRKDTERSHEWRAWVGRCRATLVLCGVPDEAFARQRAWWYFLDHASMSTGKQQHWFSLDGLSDEKLRRLHKFLEKEYGSQDHSPYLLTVVRSALR